MNATSIQVGTVQVQLLDADDVIVRMTKNGKVWEPETRAMWGELTQPETLMIDIGAYTGVYAIGSALMGAHVMAFEPHPANYKRLKANAALNSVRINMLECAVSDRTGHRALMMREAPSVLSDIASLEYGGGDVRVQTRRLDDVVMTYRVTLIKIDAEQHEPQILMGAERTMREHRPFVVVECLTPALSAAVDCWMMNMSYKVEAVLDRRNRLYRSVKR